MAKLAGNSPDLVWPMRWQFFSQSNPNRTGDYETLPDDS